MAPLSTVFMGSDAIALPLLESLYNDYKDDIKLTGIFTQPDRRKGRGMKLQENPAKQWAMEKKIPVLQPCRIGSQEYAYLRSLNCQLIFVMAYGHILSETLLALPEYGVFNFHTSLLPAYRGASPIATAISSGEKVTGVTLMVVEKEMDAGAIIDQEKIMIVREDTTIEVSEKASDACVPLLQRNLKAIASGCVQQTLQHHEKATYCRRLKKKDGMLDFCNPASSLYNRIRGLYPWPGTFFEYNEIPIKIGRASFSETSKGDHFPGIILGLENEALAVATGQGILFLHKLQRPGGKMLPVKAFLSGFPMLSGEVLKGQPMTQLVTFSKYVAAH